MNNRLTSLTASMIAVVQEPATADEEGVDQVSRDANQQLSWLADLGDNVN